MIGADKISVVHGGNILFEDVSFQVNANDKIGLIGKNGAGKSTLLKLLVGETQPDKGVISRIKDLKTGYLAQEMPLPEEKSVFDETSSAYKDLIDLNQNLIKVGKQLSERTDYDSEEYMQLVHQQADLNEKLNLGGWYEISMNVEKILLGLGFLPEDFKKSTGTFSGGWRMRIELAKILLAKPDVLLLDEPTNHLDIESIEWLENFLKNSSTPIFLISHDVQFLNNITNRTIEISVGKIYDLPLPYTKFLSRRNEMKQTLLASHKNQQKKIKDTEVFINRFRAKNTKAKQVQSRVKMLERIERIEVEEEELSSMNIRFMEAPRSGKVVLEVENLNKSFGTKEILKEINFLLSRGEKIAFVGKNGAGKTTLSKIIVGLEQYQGKMVLGHKVNLGYYAQDQSDSLKGNQDVFSVVESEGSGLNQLNLRSLLGSFLFTGEDQQKKVSVLSGGEKARLALCRLLLRPVNFLVLDEPTNHLDIQSKKILKEALKNYKGAMVVVSHDRDFLTGLTDKVYEFRNQTIHEYIGDIKEFLSDKKLVNLQELEVKAKPIKIPSKSEPVITDHEKRKNLKRSISKLERRINSIELEIKELENQITEINQKLSDSDQYTPELVTNYQELSKKLDLKMKLWEEESTKLATIQNSKE